MATANFCFYFLFGTFVLCNGKIEKRQTPCSVDTFNCDNGVCIDSTLTCDGRKDCTDGSDETERLCSHLTCPNFAFRCKYGACVPKIAKCNGNNDCADGSDEKLPECSSLSQPKPKFCQTDEYRCISGQCIDDASTCDGVRDCGDGSDETSILCKKVSCPNYSFKCKYGACISKTKKCDGVKQCIDGSDEEQCFTSTSTPRPKPSKQTQSPIVPTTTPNTMKTTCEIPYAEGYIYSYNDSNQYSILFSGTRVDLYRVVDESCEKEYYKNGPDKSIICSANGQWKPLPSNNLCLKKCPPMTSDSLDIKCTFNGENADCSIPTIPGTKLRPKCKVTHSLRNGQIETPIELLCQSNGKWSGSLYTCVPYCGRSTIKAQQLILNGSKAQYGSAPWNVGIYQLRNNTNDIICGGTLISPNLVVSAAHCFWREGLTERVLFNDGSYKVAVGKYERDISIKDNDFTQIVDVGLIYLSDKYYGSPGFHAGDIAVILLPTKVIISTVVAPACVDWTNSFTVSDGEIGKIVGWGKTEKMVASPTLLEAFLPYITYTACRKLYTDGFQFFVTSDKFCAGSKLGQGVHEGDSGGGLTYNHNGLQYLTGIVSVKDPNSNSAVAVFTDIRHHIEWVKDIYTNFTYESESRVAR